MLDHARENGYSINRIAVCNLESIEAVIQAAEITDSPIVYCIYEHELKNICQSCLEYLIKKLGSEARVPVAIFADHVQDVDTSIDIINRGYTGLMIDASRLSFEDNIRITKQVVDYAHKYGVFVEGEIGVIESGREDDKKGRVKTKLTDPVLAYKFVNRTNIDCIAVSIGVKSGFYDNYPVIDFKLLKEIKERVNVNLSLHGCSGLKEESIRKCIENGISFTAWSTDLRYAYFKKIDEIREEKGERCVIPNDILIPARDKMKDEIIEKIKQTGSDGKGNKIIYLYKKNKNLIKDDPYSNNININKLVDDISKRVLDEIRKLDI